MEIAFENVLNDEEECIFLVQHEGIFSAGKSYRESDFIGQKKLPVYHTNRGGRVTIHSKGQIVIYPIINLKKRGINISSFVHTLENWMMDVLKYIGIESRTSEKGIGVWTKDELSKLGFVGIHISKGISTHGLCLNINNDISLFESIIPCGIQNINITSVSNILGYDINIEKIAEIFIQTCPFEK